MIKKNKLEYKKILSRKSVGIEIFSGAMTMSESPVSDLTGVDVYCGSNCLSVLKLSSTSAAVVENCSYTTKGK